MVPAQWFCTVVSGQLFLDSRLSSYGSVVTEGSFDFLLVIHASLLVMLAEKSLLKPTADCEVSKRQDKQQQAWPNVGKCRRMACPWSRVQEG